MAQHSRVSFPALHKKFWAPRDTESSLLFSLLVPSGTTDFTGSLHVISTNGEYQHVKNIWRFQSAWCSLSFNCFFT
jgi:hypothetical protein